MYSPIVLITEHPSLPFLSKGFFYVKPPKLKIQIILLKWNRYLEGNENADEAAKEAVTQRPTNQPLCEINLKSARFNAIDQSI